MINNKPYDKQLREVDTNLKWMQAGLGKLAKRHLELEKKIPEWFILSVLFNLIATAIVSLLLFYSSKAKAAEYKVLEPNKVILEGEYYDYLRDPYVPEDTKEWVYGTALTTQFTIIGQPANNYRIFFDPTLHFRGTESQVRHGGLYYELGGEYLGPCRGVRVARRHHSEHVFEKHRKNKTYPNLDSYIVQLIWDLNNSEDC